MKNQRQKFILIIIFLIFIVCLFFILDRLSSKKNKIIIQKEVGRISPTVVLEKAKFYLKTKDGKIVYSQDKTITLIAYADSIKQPISGYDILLNYDQTKAKFLNHKNLLPEFQTFMPDKNKLVITGVKRLEVKSLSIFNNTPLLELTFTPLKTGPVIFNFDFTPSSKKDSNLINSRSEDILQQVKGADITIGETITLLKNQEVNIPNTKLVAKLKELSIPSEPCYDCVTGAVVEVKNNDSLPQSLNFKTGGIAGDMITQQDLFGYRFELEEVKENKIRLTLGKIQE